MKKIIAVFLAAFICLGQAGCRTVPVQKSSQETNQDAQSALRVVAGSMVGKDIDEKDLQNLKDQVQHDPEARGAVETLTGTFASQKNIVKYCPVDGQHFDASVTRCPVHGVELKTAEE